RMSGEQFEHRLDERPVVGELEVEDTGRDDDVPAAVEAVPEDVARRQTRRRVTIAADRDEVGVQIDALVLNARKAFAAVVVQVAETASEVEQPLGSEAPRDRKST